MSAVSRPHRPAWLGAWADHGHERGPHAAPDAPVRGRARGLPGDLRVGEWLVQPSLGRMSRDGTTVHLRPRLVDVLVFLASHAGEVLPGDEIVEAVWQQQYLAESVLSRSIAELRRALADDPQAPRYIETIAKRGYRLVAPVAAVTAPRRSGDAPRTFVVSHAGRRTVLAEGASLLGRDPEAVVRVGSPAVSRRHARIEVEGGSARLEDLGSRNGTLVDGVRVEGPVILRDGALVQLGSTVLVVHILVHDASTETDPVRAAGASPKQPSKDTG